MPIAAPLRLAPIAVPKVWGGHRLRSFVSAEETGADWPDDEPVGEVWLVCDRVDRASTIVGGPFDGRSLRGLMLSEADALLGEAAPAPDGSFPLLLKFLDAQQNLSVQVHPDEAAAESLGSTPKSECWYVIDADEGAEVYLGLADGVDGTAFAKGADSPDVVDLLQRYPVRAGFGVDVPAGTVHSIGAGIAIAEVQNNSDTTYRIYDWDRMGTDGSPRETHLKEALRSIDYASPVRRPGPLEMERGDARASGAVNRSGVLRDGVLFRAEVVDLHEPEDLVSPERPTVVVVLQGAGTLETTGGGEDALTRGSAWVLPADLASARVSAPSGDLRLLIARPPLAR